MRARVLRVHAIHTHTHTSTPTTPNAPHTLPLPHHLAKSATARNAINHMRVSVRMFRGYSAHADDF